MIHLLYLRNISTWSEYIFVILNLSANNLSVSVFVEEIRVKSMCEDVKDSQLGASTKKSCRLLCYTLYNDHKT